MKNEARSLTAKRRWELCEKLGEKLGIDKASVLNHLWTELVQNGMLDRILADDTVAIAEAKLLPGWQRLLASKKPPVRVYAPTDDTDPDAADMIKLACWFIKKVGGPKRARIGFEAAMHAFEEVAGQEKKKK